MKPHFDVIILTTAAVGTPHLETLRAANPDLTIHVHAAPDADDAAGRITAWRNCDRNLREWWKTQRDSVTSDAVLALEWDVFCNVDLMTIVPPLGNGYGLMGPNIKSPVRDGRSWAPFAELNRLPGGLASVALGVAPAAVMQLSRKALDAVADEQWDEVFALDIFCELRLPTIVRACGFSVEECLHWRWVGTQPMRVPSGGSGIFHPVKEEVPQ